MTTRRELIVAKAKLCYKLGRYGEMVKLMHDVVAAVPATQTVTEEERNLLAVAYKHEVSARRRAWKSLQKISRTTQTMNVENTKVFNDYKQVIVRELESLCNGLIKLLDVKLVANVHEPVGDIFYHKMKGDYYRYLAEVGDGSDKAAVYVEKAKKSYKGATEYSLKSLGPSHPLRIGLAMNYSVFMQEMLNDTAGAREHAKRFYDDALDEVASVRDVDGTRYNECAQLLKLMHLNIKSWTQPVKTQTTSNGF